MTPSSRGCRSGSRSSSALAARAGAGAADELEPRQQQGLLQAILDDSPAVEASADLSGIVTLATLQGGIADGLQRRT